MPQRMVLHRNALRTTNPSHDSGKLQAAYTGFFYRFSVRFFSDAYWYWSRRALGEQGEPGMGCPSIRRTIPVPASRKVCRVIRIASWSVFNAAP